MEWVVVAVFFVLLLPVILFLAHGGGRGRVWGLVPKGDRLDGQGAYRERRVRLWQHGSAPLSVRVAAFSSFFLGQMAIPGALAALVGFLVLMLATGPGEAPAVMVVLLLSAPTGLVVAVKLLMAGDAMLARTSDAADKARHAAGWALWHNIILMPALGASAAFMRHDGEMAIPPMAYCAFSIAHALLVRRAAGAMEAYEARHREDPAPDDAHVALG